MFGPTAHSSRSAALLLMLRRRAMLEAFEHLPALEALVDCLGDLGLAGRLGAAFAEGSFKLFDQRAAALVAQALRWWAGRVLISRSTAYNASIFAITSVVIGACFQPRNLEELAPCMRPAADLDDRTGLREALERRLKAGVGIRPN